MKMKIAAVLASSLLAVSSFAQTSSLNAATVDVEEALAEVSTEHEVAVLPLVAAVAVAVAVTEVLHHHYESPPIAFSVNNDTVDALFDR
jgi:hypothetical protein